MNKGSKLSCRTVNDMFKKYNKLAGLETVLKSHNLRYYFCSHALENDFDVHEKWHIYPIILIYILHYCIQTHLEQTC
ncbi:tyrosine-type recombinase/integrase [Bacillus cereus]